MAKVRQLYKQSAAQHFTERFPDVKTSPLEDTFRG